jgi:sarcosine oxidase
VPLDVPLLQRSLTLWKELQTYYDEHKEHFPVSDYSGQLLTMCGGLMIGKQGSEVIDGTLRSIREHDLPHKIMNNEEVWTKPLLLIFQVFNVEIRCDVG